MAGDWLDTYIPVLSLCPPQLSSTPPRTMSSTESQELGVQWRGEPANHPLDNNKLSVTCCSCRSSPASVSGLNSTRCPLGCRTQAPRLAGAHSQPWLARRNPPLLVRGVAASSLLATAGRQGKRRGVGGRAQNTWGSQSRGSWLHQSGTYCVLAISPGVEEAGGKGGPSVPGALVLARTQM